MLRWNRIIYDLNTEANMTERTELPMREERCETCRFWGLKYWEDSQEEHERQLAEGHKSGVLFCRRYPPHPKHDFPETDGSEWCGEWKAKDGTMSVTPTVS